MTHSSIKFNCFTKSSANITLCPQLGMIDVEKKLKERTEEITTLDRELKILQIQMKSKSRLNRLPSSKSPEEDSEFF